MMLIYLAAGLVVLVLALRITLRIFVNLQLSKMRRNGLYPERGKATDEDVVKLVRAGQQALAIYCHREIHHLSLAETKQAVEKLAV